MKIFIGTITCAAIALGLASSSSAQTWVKTTDSDVTVTNHNDQLNTFAVKVNTHYDWWVSIPNHFTVTGDTTQSPPWTLLYANLCDNHWTFSQEFGFTAPSNGSVTNYEDHTSESGTQSWQNQSTLVTVTRNLNSFVTNSVTYVFTPMQNGGGGA